jgi:hypothetical protein
MILRSASEPAERFTDEQREVLEWLSQALDRQVEAGAPDDSRRHHHIGVQLTAAMTRYLERRYRGRGWDAAEVRTLPSGAHLLLLERR